jgi:hypothetical protein
MFGLRLRKMMDGHSGGDPGPGSGPGAGHRVEHPQLVRQPPTSEDLPFWSSSSFTTSTTFLYHLIITIFYLS